MCTEMAALSADENRGVLAGAGRMRRSSGKRAKPAVSQPTSVASPPAHHLSEASGAWAAPSLFERRSSASNSDFHRRAMLLFGWFRATFISKLGHSSLSAALTLCRTRTPFPRFSSRIPALPAPYISRMCMPCLLAAADGRRRLHSSSYTDCATSLRIRTIPPRRGSISMHVLAVHTHTAVWRMTASTPHSPLGAAREPGRARSPPANSTRRCARSRRSSARGRRRRRLTGRDRRRSASAAAQTAAAGRPR